MNKPIEYWAVLVGMVLYVATRDADRDPLWKRLTKVIASAFLTIGLSPTLAPYFRGSETIAVVTIMGLAILALDVATALISDRAFIKELIRKRIGGGGGDGNA